MGRRKGCLLSGSVTLFSAQQHATPYTYLFIPLSFEVCPARSSLSFFPQTKSVMPALTGWQVVWYVFMTGADCCCSSSFFSSSSTITSMYAADQQTGATKNRDKSAKPETLNINTNITTRYYVPVLHHIVQGAAICDLRFSKNQNQNLFTRDRQNAHISTLVEH